MAVRYGTVRKYGIVRVLSQIDTAHFKEYVSVRYVGTLRLTSRGTGMWYARF